MKLHLCINDRFIETFIENSLAVDNLQDHYFVLYGKEEAKFLNKKIIDNISFLEKLDAENETLADLLNKSVSIYIHFLADEVWRFLQNFDLSNKNIIWIFWGADGFSLPEVSKKLPVVEKNIPAYLRKFKSKIFKHSTAADKQIFLKRITHFTHYIPEDFELIKPMLNKNCKLIPFTYGVLETIVKDIKLKGYDLIIGNSANPSNNHIYGLKIVKRSGLSLKIHCPLSYGADKSYVSKVMALGEANFGKQFIGYTELISIEKYNETILSRCSISLMLQNRSQAWGNIMQFLWQGTKVFMHKNNTLYKYLKSLGFSVYELKKSVSKADIEPLDEQSVLRNRMLLEKYFSRKSQSVNYKAVLDI